MIRDDPPRGFAKERERNGEPVSAGAGYSEYRCGYRHSLTGRPDLQLHRWIVLDTAWATGAPSNMAAVSIL